MSKKIWKLDIKVLILIITALLLLIASLVVGADANNTSDKENAANTTNADVPHFIDRSIGDMSKEADTLGKGATEALYKIVVDNFEDAGEWGAEMPRDQGLVKARGFIGGPKSLRKWYRARGLYGPTWNTKEEGKTTYVVPRDVPKMRKGNREYSKFGEYYQPYKDERKGILGVKVEFMKRGFNWFSVKPARPIQLEGIVKAFELWVCGRNFKHELYVVVDDLYGRPREIFVGSLNFLGWRRMTVQVPLTITQENYRFANKRGLSFRGFLIKCNPVESYGKYYIYFDNLSAEISRFWEENQDVFDPVDNW